MTKDMCHNIHTLWLLISSNVSVINIIRDSSSKCWLFLNVKHTQHNNKLGNSPLVSKSPSLNLADHDTTPPPSWFFKIPVIIILNKVSRLSHSTVQIIKRLFNCQVHMIVFYSFLFIWFVNIKISERNRVLVILRFYKLFAEWFLFNAKHEGEYGRGLNI